MALDSTTDSYPAKHGLRLDLLNHFAISYLQLLRQRTFQLTNFVANYISHQRCSEYSDYPRASQCFPLHLELTAYLRKGRKQHLATENILILSKGLYLDRSVSIYGPYF